MCFHCRSTSRVFLMQIFSCGKKMGVTTLVVFYCFKLYICATFHKCGLLWFNTCFNAVVTENCFCFTIKSKPWSSLFPLFLKTLLSVFCLISLVFLLLLLWCLLSLRFLNTFQKLHILGLQCKKENYSKI